MPIRYGFSGSRVVNNEQMAVIKRTLAELPPGDEYTTGACVGVDDLVGRWCWRHHSSALHRVIVPANRSRVASWWLDQMVVDPLDEEDIVVEEMPAGTTYKDRNQRIVDCSDILLAFPAYAENDPKSSRSGTWQTIRMARRAGLEVRTIELHISQ